jgi:hypothetical protein
MHTKIRSSKNLMEVLWYHERKVKKEVAECIYAGNMIKDAEDLTLKEKSYHIERLLSLNDRVEKKVLHTIVSFHTDDHPEKEKLRQLIREYMEGMGWARQPYVAYLHQDTQHLHVHIVSSRICWDGPRIDPSRRVTLKSFELSRRLEDEHGLFQAGRRMPDQEWAEQHPLQVVQLGVTPLRPAINAVLDHVIPHYNYTSLEELNAVLGLYKVKAIVVHDERRTRQHQGIVYAPLDENGVKEHAYLTARVLRQKATLKVLEARFEANRPLREMTRARVITSIDWAMAGKAPSVGEFKSFLEKRQIQVVLRDDQIYYVDQQSQAVLSGTSLGERYSATSILQRCQPENVEQQRLKEQLTEKPRLRHGLPGAL